ncbi:MAG: hypothetical protein ACJ759_13805 [Thermoanaerobaculia bacterium]
MTRSGKPDAPKGRPSRKTQRSELRSAHLAVDPEWRYLTPVRESALSYLPGEIASIVQSLSSWVLDSYVDGLTANQRTFRGSWPKMQLRAAMLDLRHTARWLAIAAESASASDLRSDVRLAGLADELALAVERFAGLIDEQIKGVGRGRSSGGRS